MNAPPHAAFTHITDAHNDQTSGSRFIFFLLCLWVYISALYYIENLFIPSFAVGYDEGTLHKAVKYFTCIAISAYASLKTKNGVLIFLSLSLIAYALTPVFINGELSIASVSVLVAATMSGMVGVIPIYRDRVATLSKAVVISGCIVSIFSVIELTLLAPLFEARWRATGGIRSISTLLNPNNLGLYIGAGLLILPFLRMGTIKKSVIACLLCFSFVASGSRTAWVALALTPMVALLGSPAVRQFFGRLIRRNLISLFILGAVAFSGSAIMWSATQNPDIESLHRGSDLYTASIRVENFFKYFEYIDGSILLPDINGVREGFIQDNFYLVFVNSFGILMSITMIGYLALNFSFSRHTNNDLLPWRLMVIYYLISGLSGSFLNSFPNNQIFFIAVGSVLVAQRPRRSPLQGSSHNGRAQGHLEGSRD